MSDSEQWYYVTYYSIRPVEVVSESAKKVTFAGGRSALKETNRSMIVRGLDIAKSVHVSLHRKEVSEAEEALRSAHKQLDEAERNVAAYDGKGAM